MGFRSYYNTLDMATTLSRSSLRLESNHADCTTLRYDASSYRFELDTASFCTSCLAFPQHSFYRFLELPRELLDQVYRACCEPYQVTFSYSSSGIIRDNHRQFCPLKRLEIRDPPSTNFSMTSSRIFSELEEIRRDAFDGEVRMQYDEVEGLSALYELCNSDRYSWIRERVIKLVIRGTKGLDFNGPDYLLELWSGIARPGNLPHLREIDITYEAKRSKYVVKEDEFELPTEEWYRVGAQEYIDSFQEGGEDIEYEYPSELLHLCDLKRLLAQNGKPDCEVFLTTRVTWKQLRDEESATEQNGHQSIQRVTFRVASDDLEGIERIYQ